jgi:hypothetical protein
MTRAFLLVLAAIAFGLGGLYLVRAGAGGGARFKLGSPSSLRHLAALPADWRFWLGGGIALIGRFFLDEQVTMQRWIGILTIITGVVVLLRS